MQRSKYAPNNWLNAALAGIDDGHNGGGPIWAILDSDALAREGWQPQPPHVDVAAGFFFSANRLADLARKIVMKDQRVPMPPANLEETVMQYNSFVESGVDADFDKPTPRHRIEKPPFYAAWATPVVHDTRAGLRIDPTCRVIENNARSRARCSSWRRARIAHTSLGFSRALLTKEARSSQRRSVAATDSCFRVRRKRTHSVGLALPPASGGDANYGTSLRASTSLIRRSPLRLTRVK